MIVLTRFPNGERIALNNDLIERADGNPDTTITLTDGTRYIVQESVDEVVQLVKRYRAEIMVFAHQIEDGVEPDAALGHLRLVGPDSRGRSGSTAP